MQELELRLTLDEVNQVLSSLGGQPYKDVFALVTKIQQQAQRQLQELETDRPAPSSSAE